MASEIDELVLNIDISGLKKQNIDEINSLATAIERLNSAVANVSNINGYFKNLSKLSNIVQSNAKGTATNKISTGDVLKTANVDLQATDTEIANTNALAKAYENNSKNAKSNRIAISKLKDEHTELDKNTKASTGFMGKFFVSLKRIALYRLIRTALKAIAQSLKEGFQNYAQYSDETNKAASSIYNAANQLKNSLGVTSGLLVQIVAPAIETISDALVDLINNINLAIASLDGMEGTYSRAKKLNEDYAKSLKKTNSQLLSFDKFEALNKSNGTSPAEMFEEASIAEDWNDTAEIFSAIFEIIKTIIISIKNVITTLIPIIKEVLLIIEKIVTAVADGINLLANIKLGKITLLESLLYGIVGALLAVAAANLVVMLTNPVGWIVAAVAAVSAAIAILVKNWDSVSKWFEKTFKAIGDFFINTWKKVANGFASIINGIANAFISFVNVCIDGLNALLKPVNLLGQAFGADTNFAQIHHWNAHVNWTPYADGGTFEKGTAFIAGEAGAEVVYNNRNSSQGGVLNIEQFETAMVRALASYGVARGDDMRVSSSIYIDKTKVGQAVEKAVYREGVRVGDFKIA